MATPEPAPLTAPQRKGRVLNPDADALKRSAERSSVDAR
jgi:hypothetical protein